MNDTGQEVSSINQSLKGLNDREFRLAMADEVWMKVKGIPIPDCYSEEDRLGIYDRYYHRAVSMSQGE
jgi:hypothetical protein